MRKANRPRPSVCRTNSQHARIVPPVASTSSIEQHATARREGVGVNFQAVGAVFEGVLHRDRGIRGFPGLRIGRSPRSSVDARGAEDEAARSAAAIVSTPAAANRSTS